MDPPTFADTEATLRFEQYLTQESGAYFVSSELGYPEQANDFLAFYGVTAMMFVAPFLIIFDNVIRLLIVTTSVVFLVILFRLAQFGGQHRQKVFSRLIVICSVLAMVLISLGLIFVTFIMIFTFGTPVFYLLAVALLSWKLSLKLQVFRARASS